MWPFSRKESTTRRPGPAPWRGVPALEPVAALPARVPVVAAPVLRFPDVAGARVMVPVTTVVDGDQVSAPVGDPPRREVPAKPQARLPRPAPARGPQPMPGQIVRVPLEERPTVAPAYDEGTTQPSVWEEAPADPAALGWADGQVEGSLEAPPEAAPAVPPVAPGQDLSALIAMLDGEVRRSAVENGRDLPAQPQPETPRLLRPTLAASRRRGQGVGRSGSASNDAKVQDTAGTASSEEVRREPVDDVPSSPAPTRAEAVPTDLADSPVAEPEPADEPEAKSLVEPEPAEPPRTDPGPGHPETSERVHAPTGDEVTGMSTSNATSADEVEVVELPGTARVPASPAPPSSPTDVEPMRPAPPGAVAAAPPVRAAAGPRAGARAPSPRELIPVAPESSAADSRRSNQNDAEAQSGSEPEIGRLVADEVSAFGSVEPDVAEAEAEVVAASAREWAGEPLMADGPDHPGPVAPVTDQRDLGRGKARSPERRDQSAERRDQSAERRDQSPERRDQSPGRRDQSAGRWDQSAGEAQQVPPATVASFGRLTGIDLGFVPLVRGPEVAANAAQRNAVAYTEGGAVHLPAAAGPVGPAGTAGPSGSVASERVLAHELTHVMQQRAFGDLAREDGPWGDALEAQAVAVERHVAGETVRAADLEFPAGLEPDPAALVTWSPEAGFRGGPTSASPASAQHASLVPSASPEPLSALVDPVDPGPATAALEEESPSQPLVYPEDPPPAPTPPAAPAPMDHQALSETVAGLVADRLQVDLPAARINPRDPELLDQLARGLYGRLRTQLRAELLADRERVGMLTEFH